MTDHGKLPDRMSGRTRIAGGCSCGDRWPCRIAAIDAIDARWNDLREYLKTCISDLEQDIEGKPRDAQRFPRGQAAAFAHVLQHMLELEGKR